MSNGIVEVVSGGGLKIILKMTPVGPRLKLKGSGSIAWMTGLVIMGWEDQG